MKLTNKFDAPASIVAAIEADPYTKDGADFSVTELISPPQIRRLWKKHEEEISIDVRDEVWKLLGAVKTEFGKFGDTLDGVNKKLAQASKNMEDAARRSRASPLVDPEEGCPRLSWQRISR